mgnify:CR=1 FL=1
MRYLKENFTRLPINIYAVNLEDKETLLNLTLFFTTPRKLRSLKLYECLYKFIKIVGLKYPFIKLLGAYGNWNG